MFTLPQQSVSPVSVLPVGSQPNSLLHVYDGLPDDEQPWLDEALSLSRVCGTPASVRALEAFAVEPLGAPIGPDVSRSLRVARATGLVVNPDCADQDVLGVALAHGCLYATWRANEEGDILDVVLQSPTSFGWGAGKDSLAQEQLMARCLRQYERQVVSLVEGVQDAHLAAAISLTFSGDWDESTELIQRRLAAACVTSWSQLCADHANQVHQMAA